MAKMINFLKLVIIKFFIDKIKKKKATTFRTILMLKNFLFKKY